jgi:hypothetical protein
MAKLLDLPNELLLMTLEHTVPKPPCRSSEDISRWLKPFATNRRLYEAAKSAFCRKYCLSVSIGFDLPRRVSLGSAPKPRLTTFVDAGLDREWLVSNMRTMRLIFYTTKVEEFPLAADMLEKLLSTAGGLRSLWVIVQHDSRKLKRTAGGDALAAHAKRRLGQLQVKREGFGYQLSVTVQDGIRTKTLEGPEVPQYGFGIEAEGSNADNVTAVQ